MALRHFIFIWCTQRRFHIVSRSETSLQPMVSTYKATYHEMWISRSSISSRLIWLEHPIDITTVEFNLLILFFKLYKEAARCIFYVPRRYELLCLPFRDLDLSFRCYFTLCLLLSVDFLSHFSFFILHLKQKLLMNRRSYILSLYTIVRSTS